MKREEKNTQTRRKIIDSALREFSEKTYGEASLNTICSEGDLSKGIIYHYFKDKDELYLACVAQCYDALTAYLDGVVTAKNVPLEQGLASYFDARIHFFAEHPLYLGVFCSTILTPPAHLLPALDPITAAFDAQVISVLTALLQSATLCPGITVEDVVTVFREYQDFVNARFQMKRFDENTLKEHEEHCRRSLRILLYGVIARKE
ncbi:MAG: TetR/AcrR family transcriptional regulator [Eubacteriales bacterium]|nr:TetR/AcrR family transcriptional regulator [Eubacteriales bacterium]